MEQHGEEAAIQKPTGMDDKVRAEMRDYAWKYFSLHADQRLKTFNFYLILATVVLGGLLAFLRDTKVPWLGIPAGAVFAVLSFVFWKLDQRNRELVGYGEDAIKVLDRQTISGLSGPDVEKLCLIAHEEAETEKKRQPGKWSLSSPRSWPDVHMKYSECFGFVFCLLGLLGAIIAVASIVLCFLGTGDSRPVPVQQQFFIGTPKSE